MTKNNESYQKLKIINDYHERVELGGKPLDFDKYYDIKTPTGQLYEGCKVVEVVNDFKGLGGMSESTSTVSPFFKANGLEIKLKSGFLMRINEQVTAQKYARRIKREKNEKLQELYRERDELNKEIADLKSK